MRLSSIAIIFASILVIVSCGAGSTKADYAAPKVQSSNTDGWELVGEKQHCKLYYRVIHGDGVYWSICEASWTSSSIAN